MKHLASFLILFLFWILWSGKFDALHLAMGVVSIMLISAWVIQLQSKTELYPNLKSLVAFEAYSFWLFYEIVIANIEVLKLSFSSQLSEVLDPHMIELDANASGEFAQFLLANSITLTPGTVTMGVEGQQLEIHSLLTGSESGLQEIDARISRIFNERKAV
mgnify:CR=1 FL=1